MYGADPVEIMRGNNAAPRNYLGLASRPAPRPPLGLTPPCGLRLLSLLKLDASVERGTCEVASDGGRSGQSIGGGAALHAARSAYSARRVAKAAAKAADKLRSPLRHTPAIVPIVPSSRRSWLTSGCVGLTWTDMGT